MGARIAAINWFQVDLFNHDLLLLKNVAVIIVPLMKEQGNTPIISLFFGIPGFIFLNVYKKFLYSSQLK